MKTIQQKSFKAILFSLAILCTGCFEKSARYDQDAYAMSVRLKVESAELIQHAHEAFSIHQDAVETLYKELRYAQEYAKGRPHNTYVIKQWNLLLDTDGHLLGGLLQRWAKEGQLKTFFVDEMKILIDKSFDQIIGLESGLIKEPNS